MVIQERVAMIYMQKQEQIEQTRGTEIMVQVDGMNFGVSITKVLTVLIL